MHDSKMKMKIVLKKDSRILFELTDEHEWISVELLTNEYIELVNGLRDFCIRESEKAEEK